LVSSGIHPLQDDSIFLFTGEPGPRGHLDYGVI